MTVETEIWIYWLFCAIAGVAVITNWNFIDGLLHHNSALLSQRQGYTISLILGWLLTLLAAIAYIFFTDKFAAGSYQISDLILFVVSNGILEQLMFIFWFLLGCYLGSLYDPKNLKVIFISGYISTFIFSGLIHRFFWLAVLPPHKFVAPVIVPLLAVASLAWMWLLWRYRAVWAIVAMHAVMDFVAIGHLHFRWFEALQSQINL
jgi:hypothetical protein